MLLGATILTYIAFAGEACPMLVQNCPKCGTSKTRLAPRKTVSDRLLSILTIYPWRCQLCTTRFRTFVGRPTANQRRNYERVHVEFPVWFKPSRSGDQGLGRQGVMENVSVRGCRIRCDAPVPTGTHLKLEFQPSNCSFPITIDGAIVRTSSKESIGLRFVRLLREDELRIRQIMDLWLPETPVTLLK